MRKKIKKDKENKNIISCDVPSWKRFVAYMVDWYLGSMFISLPMVMIYMKATNTDELNVNLLQYPEKYALIAGGVGLIFAFFYYFIVPLKIWKGQTLGKHWCHFKITKGNGEDVTSKDLFLRQVIGIFIIEGSLISASNILHQIMSLVTNKNFITPLMYLGIAISVISALLVLFRKDHKAIHDFIAKTKVVSIVNPS